MSVRLSTDEALQKKKKSVASKVDRTLTVWKLQKFSLTLFSEKFRESFTKEIPIVVALTIFNLPEP